MFLPDIIIFGSFGFGNAGDEAVPFAIADMLTELGAEGRIHTVTRFDSPKTGGVIGMGSEYVEFHRKMEGFPIIICGGGVIEPNDFSCLLRAESFMRRFSPGKATLLGCSVEAGVNFSWRTRWRLLWLLRSLGTVYTRDLLSERTLKRLIPSIKTQTIGDLVLWMSPERTPTVVSLRIRSRFIACVLSSCWSGDDEWTNWIVDELARAAQDLNAAIVFLPMSTLHDDDRVEHARISERIRMHHSNVEIYEIVEKLNPREVCQVIADSTVTISMRLHGCVMAYAQRRPFVSIGYHPKVFGFLETVGCLKTVVPQVPPKFQAPGRYGYVFSELKIKPNDLSVAIENALNTPLGEGLDELKSNSLGVLRSLVRI